MTTTGSTGTLVSAALETAGQHIQSWFLDVLCAGAGMHIGALCVLVSALVAFFMFAMGGQYNLWKIFLIGPGLFFFTIYTRVETQGTKWSFGDKDYDFSIIDTLFGEEFLDYTDADKPVKVSWLFARWNTFTSAIVEEIIARLPTDAQEGNLKLLRQAQKYSTLFNMNIDNNELSTLLTKLVYNRRCTEYLSLTLSTHQEPNLYDELEEYTDDDGDTYYSNEYIEAAKNISVISKYDPQTKDMWKYLQSRAPGHLYGDDEILGVSISDIIVGLSSFNTIINFFSSCGTGEPIVNLSGQVDSYTDQLNEYIDSQAGQLIQSLLGLQIPTSLTCEDLWAIGVDLTADYASQKINTLIQSTLLYDEDDEDTNPDLSFKLLASKFDYQGHDISEDIDDFDDAAENMYRHVALRILLTYMTTINPSQLKEGTSDTTVSDYLPENYSGVSDDIRYQAVADLHDTKGQLVALVWGLPQMQGVVLFFLSISFPFFAFTFLLPGRHWSIGTWMSLWFWVKSWDIGFALVMIVDQILDYLLPKQPEITDAIFYNPGEAMNMMFQNEPNVPLSFYYSILGSLLLGVPVVTGFIVKRGGSAVTGIVGRGIQQYTKTVGYAYAQTSRNSERDATQTRNSVANNSLPISKPSLASSALSKGSSTGSSQGNSNEWPKERSNETPTHPKRLSEGKEHPDTGHPTKSGGDPKAGSPTKGGGDPKAEHPTKGGGDPKAEHPTKGGGDPKAGHPTKGGSDPETGHPTKGGSDPKTGHPPKGGSDPETGHPPKGGSDPATGHPPKGGSDPATGRPPKGGSNPATGHPTKSGDSRAKSTSTTTPSRSRSKTAGLRTPDGIPDTGDMATKVFMAAPSGADRSLGKAYLECYDKYSLSSDGKNLVLKEGESPADSMTRQKAAMFLRDEKLGAEIVPDAALRQQQIDALLSG